MPAILPTIIAGPAIVQFGGYSFYTQGPIVHSLERRSFDVQSDMFGPISTRHSSQVSTIRFTPVGEIEVTASQSKLYPYGPSSLVTTSSIGLSVLTGALVIHRLEGETITFHRAGMTQYPSMILRPLATAYGEVVFTAIGKSATQPSDAAFWRTIAATAFAEASFDETKVRTGIYSATWNGLTLGASDGFNVAMTLATAEIPDDNIGVADIRLTGMQVACSFRPNNKTLTEVTDSLLNVQGTTAIYPGESYAKQGSALVITDGSLTLTIHKAGPSSYDSETFAASANAHGTLRFTSDWRWTGGAVQPLFTITAT